jgi:type I restriction enzyme M protein
VVVRVKPEYQEQYPQEWLFAALRSEACRLQFWTESGGTSYGKLTFDNVRDVMVPTPGAGQRKSIAQAVKEWFQTVESAARVWSNIGSPEDRFPVVNSPSFGLVEQPSDIDMDEDED